MDPDPGGPKTCGPGRSGTLVRRLCIICLLCVDGQQSWHYKVPWSEKWSEQHSTISCGDINYRGGIHFYQLWSATRKRFFVTVSTGPLLSGILAADPALLVQKSYCYKSSAPGVELRFCPWLSVPIMCIPSDGQ
jgi:hypothetical protein